MAIPSAIETLIELASKDTDDAARRLGRAIAAADEAEQKHILLVQYRDEYGARLQEKLAAGLAAMECRNFQLFLVKLDDAIVGQQLVVRDARRRIEQERSAWQASERKRMSYRTLATRARTVRQHQEIRHDQKQTDEHAARRHLYRR
ncbi:MAG: flagellar export protein FliJ [Pseudomonadota bacterium]